MTLKKLEISGFKSFGRKATLFFDAPVVAIVGPNGSGKSNVAEAFRWVLGEQSLKSLRGKRGEDLIFNGSSSLGRLSRASVSVTFDNTDRKFNLDFDEVTIAREVFRDGANEYTINGSQVRLRDVLELLANVSLGPSGHHIISQGEADRILNSNMVERRAMIEEALGLKLYQWKLQESERKLAKTEENIRQVESLRREIAPHLKFLKKQMEKVAKANEMREDLGGRYREYLKREEIYLDYWKKKIAEDMRGPQEELERLEQLLAAQTVRAEAPVGSGDDGELREIEAALRTVRQQKDELARRIGRLEGMIEMTERVSRPAETKIAETATIARGDLEAWRADVIGRLTKAEEHSDLYLIKTLLRDIKNLISGFLVGTSEKMPDPVVVDREGELSRLRAEKAEVENRLGELRAQESELFRRLTEAKSALEAEKEKARSAERETYELRARRSELLSGLSAARSRREALAIEEENFKREVGEAGVLIGRAVLNYQEFMVDATLVVAEERNWQEDRRRQIEKIKIRLEDIGVEGTDVVREHDEVTKRDEFLAHELEDLAAGAKSLTEVMADLRGKIDLEFKQGIKKINSEFQKFFAVLFGGGNAALEVQAATKKKEKLLDPAALAEAGDLLSDETAGEEGIEIAVSLPRKKIKGLAMLSGGERALTSIALLFAMSQVNPPPFLILDETDAALDEANSRKYADMIENLSKYSQLILITHNRETMSRAGILYGVTMGSDSISRLISIKFEEATQFAK